METPWGAPWCLYFHSFVGCRRLRCHDGWITRGTWRKQRGIRHSTEENWRGNHNWNTLRLHLIHRHHLVASLYHEEGVFQPLDKVPKVYIFLFDPCYYSIILACNCHESISFFIDEPINALPIRNWCCTCFWFTDYHHLHGHKNTRKNTKIQLLRG